MEWLWWALLAALFVAILWSLATYGRSRISVWWPWWDARRGDGALQEYAIEEELRRERESSRDRDLAP